MVIKWNYFFIIICFRCFTAVSSYQYGGICDAGYTLCEIEGFGNESVVSNSVGTISYSMIVKHYKIPVWNSMLLKNYVNIQNLNLQNNNIESIEAAAVHNFPNLKTLDLRYNFLKTIPLNTFTQSAHLKYIDLSFNNLTSLDSFFNIKGPLEELHLQNNNLTNIDGISKFSYLRILKLNENDISVFPYTEINNLKLLETLDLSSNKIADHNDCVIRSIRSVINLSYNLLQNICKLAGGIKYADFSHNYIKTINKESFYEAKALEQINLSENQISILEANTFEGLESLKYLNLSYNKIERLEFPTFHHLTNLKILNLSHNKLEFLEHSIFGSLYLLQELYLNNNNIQNLNANEFFSLRNLYSLNLLHNPLHDLDIEKLSKFRNSLSNLYINLTNLDCGKYNKYSAAVLKSDFRKVIINHTEGVDNCTESSVNVDEKSGQLQEIEAILRPLLKLHIVLTIFAILLLTYLVLIAITYCQKFIRKYNK